MTTTFKRETNADRQQKRLETRQRIAEKVALSAGSGVECVATTTTKTTRKARMAMSSGGERSRAGGARRKSIQRSGDSNSRTAVENVVIYRSHRKRLGASKLGTTKSERRAIMAAVTPLRIAAKEGKSGAVKKYFEAVAARSAAIIKAKITKEKLIDTGQLLASITPKTDNV